jgi:heat shock protein HtpX
MYYNTLKTGILLVLLAAILMLIGGAIGGRGGLLIALLIALSMNLISYWYSDRIVLRMYGAQEVSEAEAPQLYGMVRRLAQRAQIPMPRVHILASSAPNAFATGRNPQHAAVAVTEGTLRLLDQRELEGVLAHELAHIKNRDTLTMTVTATIASAIMFLANMAQWAAVFGGVSRDDDEHGGGGVLGLLVAAIVAPLAATMVQMAISRSREYAADTTGAQIAGTPYGLADALEKLDYATQRIPAQVTPATAHLFIVNPLNRQHFATLFSTHPPLEERVQRLRRMGRGF